MFWTRLGMEQGLNNVSYGWGRVLVPPQGDTHMTIWYVSLSSTTRTKAPIKMQNDNFRLSTSPGPQIGWNQKADD